MLQGLKRTNTALKSMVDTLQYKLSVASELLKSVRSDVVGPPGKRKRHRTPKHYSPRHERRLKRQCAESCSAALAWMEAKGYQLFKEMALIVRTQEIEIKDLKEFRRGSTAVR